MKIFISFEYAREAAGFKKRHGIGYGSNIRTFTYGAGHEITVYVNGGGGYLTMLHRLYAQYMKDKPDLVINAGFCGSLSQEDAIPGEVFEISGAVAADLAAMRPFGHPVSPAIVPLHGKRLVTVPYLTEGHEKKWLYFGDLVDMEGYYVMDWGRRSGVPAVILKQVTDRNENAHESVRVSDPGPLGAALDEYLDRIIPAASSEFGLEIMQALKTGVDSYGAVIRLSEQMCRDRMSFSSRRMLYNRIRIENNGSIDSYFGNTTTEAVPGGPPLKKGMLFLERGIEEKESYIRDFPGYTPVETDDYLGIFQNKTDEKTHNVFIAVKRGETVKKTPADYGRKGFDHYTVVCGYNCPFDCHYCYLQGNLRSRDEVIFINKEDIWGDMKKVHVRGRRSVFHFGDVCDALTVDAHAGYIGFMSERLDGGMYGEFRTKSAGTDHLSKARPNGNIVIGWSLSTDDAIEKFERGTPSAAARLKAARRAAGDGWNISLHYDPVIMDEKEGFDPMLSLIHEAAELIPASHVFSVSMGTLRVNRNTYREIRGLSGRSAVLRGLERSGDMYRYPESYRKEAFDVLGNALKAIYGERFYVCMD